MINRRKFVQSTMAAAAGFNPANSQTINAVPKAESLLGKVKIRDVQTASVMIKYPAHLVRVITDQGVIGLCEAHNRAGIVDLDVRRDGSSTRPGVGCCRDDTLVGTTEEMRRTCGRV